MGNILISTYCPHSSLPLAKRGKRYMLLIGSFVGSLCPEWLFYTWAIATGNAMNQKGSLGT
jgi:hypothetical protein